jgi:endoglucanase Acf2
VQLDCCDAVQPWASSPPSTNFTASPPPASAASPLPDAVQAPQPSARSSDLLDGPPIGSTSLEHFAAATAHPLPPSALWADAAAPLPTNAWWENLVLQDGGELGGNTISPLPYLAQALPDGLHVSLPQPADTVASTDSVILPFSSEIHFGASGLTDSVSNGADTRTVASHDQLSVTVLWQAGAERRRGAWMRAPLVRGAPYATALFGGGARPTLGFGASPALKVSFTAAVSSLWT